MFENIKKINTKILWVIAGMLIALIIIAIVWLLYNRSNNEADKAGDVTQKMSTSTTPTTVLESFSKKLFFIHHSTGDIYWNGGLEQSLINAGYEVAAPWWDPETNPPDFYLALTNPDQWQILEPYSIIVFKSCFPASDITSDEMLEEYKAEYIKLYEIYAKYPDKLFVPLSTPPLLESHTTADSAKRSLEFEEWLVGEYISGYSGKNLAPFKLHSLLSDDSGYLAHDFISSLDDDHPNAHSGEIVGPALVQHLSPYTN